MFYYKHWEEFCSWLAGSGLRICTAEQSLKLAEGVRFVVLKHDVEAAVPKAYRLAEIEHQNGLCGSYYVQAYLLEREDNVRLLQQMQQWGHEISYHYDVLDAHAGNYEAAEADFKRYLRRFEECGFHFATICQHGNPIKTRVGYTSNRDFFRNSTIRQRYPQFVDMVVNYSHYTKQAYQYISDVGYRWNVITDPETNDLHPEVKNLIIGGFESLKHCIQKTNRSFIVSTHPHRWKQSALSIYLMILFFRIVRQCAIIAKHIPGMSYLMNQFYFLAKRI